MPALAGVLQLERGRARCSRWRVKRSRNNGRPCSPPPRPSWNRLSRKPVGPGRAQGRLEIARLAAYLGQALLTRALREEDAAIARKAEQQFIQAGRELDKAIKVLEELKASYKNPDKEKADQVKQQLSQDLLQARFDRASNFIDRALTYIDTSSDSDNRKRAEVIDQAMQAFKQIAGVGGPVGLLASAWLVKVNQEGQDPTEAEKHRKRVMEQTSKAAQPAQPLGQAFLYPGDPEEPDHQAGSSQEEQAD